MNRITPEWITELKEDEIFVFGSNTSGRHGKGAAKTAMKWGAVYGQGEGLQGKTYGIPTVNSSITNSLSLFKIKMYVDRFLSFAELCPKYKFFVTEIGCGLAGLKIKDIAPMFERATKMENVFLPRRFLRRYK